MSKTISSMTETASSARSWWRGIAMSGLLLVTACTAAVRPQVAQPSGLAPPASSVPQAPSSPATPHTRWRLTWSDNFNGPASLRQWTFETNGFGGYVKQLQWYDRQNATVDGRGHLVITASKGGGGHRCWYGTCRYTSVRMHTMGSFAQTYGRFEARIKLPAGAGLWPAFWMEGADVTQVGWPASGEIDIVEPDNRHPTLVESYSHGSHQGIKNYLTMPAPLSAGYHVYGVDWSTQQITWWIDGYVYAHLKYYPGWPYDHPFFLVLDLAVGGGYPGPPTAQTPFPAHMLVDWIRVYRAVP